MSTKISVGQEPKEIFYQQTGFLPDCFYVSNGSRSQFGKNNRAAREKAIFSSRSPIVFRNIR